MPSHIVDPTDSNVAILADGGIGHAIRLIPSGAIADQNAPTVRELNAALIDAPILGYGRMTFAEEDRA